MFTGKTYQDWVADGATPKLALEIIGEYKGAPDFCAGLEANRYFAGENPSLDDKWLVRIHTEEAKDANGRVTKRAIRQNVAGNRVSSRFLFRFVTQEVQFLLGNGVVLDEGADKARLGFGFDKALEQLAKDALLHGVAYGYWNADHLEVLPAVKDALSGCVALLDEMTGDVGAAIQFWQISSDKPMYFRLFEPDGVTLCRQGGGDVEEIEPKRPYKQHVRADALGQTIVGGENYAALPVIALYASGSKGTEMTPSIRSKIDLYDRIQSDFGDNLDRANDVYWVLNNFGGNTTEAVQMLQEIQTLKLAMNMSDGTGGGSTAEPHTIEVPYAARQTALELLRKALYADAMALDVDALTGGSLTNVAIQAATINLNLKCDQLEWQCFQFVQRVLALAGMQTEEIKWKRREITNRSEIVQDIAVMRADIDLETALKLNPYIEQDEIAGIMQNLDAEEQTGMPGMNELEKRLQEGADEAEEPPAGGTKGKWPAGR